MKALEYLYAMKNANEQMGQEPINIYEAIEELENFQNENKSLIKTLEKYNKEMIELRKENQDLLNTIIEAQKVIKNVLEGNKWTVQTLNT